FVYHLFTSAQHYVLCLTYNYVTHTSLFFSFTNYPPTYIYTLSLHDALPIFLSIVFKARTIYQIIMDVKQNIEHLNEGQKFIQMLDRKSTRLNSSHVSISYAVFCLKKKKYKILNEEGIN